MIGSIGNISSISQLFAKLDTKSQGYLEESDLISAFGQINSGDSTAASDIFSALDSDSDGKVTESEFSSTLSKLQEVLDSQFDTMRMSGFSGSQGPGGMAGMPPPPPPSDDDGFSKEELTAQLGDIGESDSARASFISNIVDNFEAADSDGNGKVSFAEAQSYNSDTTASAPSDSSASTSASSQSPTENRLLMKIMQLMHAYGGNRDNDSASSLSSQLSVSA